MRCRELDCNLGDAVSPMFLEGVLDGVAMMEQWKIGVTPS